MRLVIADDSAVVRDGLRHALGALDHEIVGTATDGAELLACVQREQPDVALVDIRMPPTHTTEGLDAAFAIRRSVPEVGLLVLSQYVEADYALTLLRESPARSGYLLKDRITELTTLLDAIQRVGCGETVVDPELVDLLLNRPANQSRLADLSERERTVLALLAEGSQRPGDRRTTVAHPEDGRDPRPPHPRQAGASARRRSQPARARSAHVAPQSGLTLNHVALQGCP